MEKKYKNNAKLENIMGQMVSRQSYEVEIRERNLLQSKLNNMIEVHA